MQMLTATLALLLAHPLQAAPPAGNYATVQKYNVLGWFTNGRYLVCDSDLGSAAMSSSMRIVLDSQTGKANWQWLFSPEEDTPLLDKQSEAWLKKHKPSGAGKAVWQFKGEHFDDKEIPAHALAPSTASFTAGKNKYTVRLEQSFGPSEKIPVYEGTVRRAKFTVSIRKGTGSWKKLYQDQNFKRTALGHSLEKIILSPNGTGVAVVCGVYHVEYFEGINYFVTFLPVAGKLP